MNKKKIKSILKNDLFEIIRQSSQVFKKYNKPGIDLCSIVNAKSGACSEDCKFCAQSAHYDTHVETYALRSIDDILKAAESARQNGVKHFGIVTSGHGLDNDDIEKIAQAIEKIRTKTGLKICTSLGTLTEEQMLILKNAGLSRYHHNIETSPAFYPRIVSTHSFQERVNTVKLIKKLGMEICSGGIIGLGESMDDRIDMALLLKELDVDSIPINILVPIKGTPLEQQQPLSMAEIIRTIAMFRLVLKDKTIKIAAGRESVLKDFQSLAFLAGANGMLIGGYLTIRGRSVDDDLKMAKNLVELI